MFTTFSVLYVLPQNGNFLKYFLSVMFTSKHIIFTLFGRIKQYFSWLYCSIFLCAILLSCGIARPVIQAETGVTASARVVRPGQ